MQFLTLTLVLATAINASPILRRHNLNSRDQFPSIPAISATSNKIVEIPGTAADIVKRDLAVAAVDPSSNKVIELQGNSALKSRDQFPSIVAVSHTTNQLVEVPGTAADVVSKRDNLAIPAVSQTLNRVVELVGTSASTQTRRRSDNLEQREANGIVPVVTAGNKIVAVDMSVEGIEE